MTVNQPLISVDTVLVRLSRAKQALEFGVIERTASTAKGTVYEHALSLPGVLLKTDERLEDAARRAAAAKAQTSNLGYLRQLGVFDAPERDPRGPTIAIAFLAPLADETSSPELTWLEAPEGLAFDHDSIIAAARTHCRELAWVDLSFTKALLGDVFTTKDANALRPPTLEAKNTARWLRHAGFVKPAPLASPAGGRGRPASAWTWLES